MNNDSKVKRLVYIQVLVKSEQRLKWQHDSEERGFFITGIRSEWLTVVVWIDETCYAQNNSCCCPNSVSDRISNVKYSDLVSEPLAAAVNGYRGQIEHSYYTYDILTIGAGNAKASFTIVWYVLTNNYKLLYSSLGYEIDQRNRKGRGHLGLASQNKAFQVFLRSI